MEAQPIQREYWDLIRPLDLKVDHYGLNLLHFQIAEVTERNVHICYTYVREQVFEINVGTLSHLHTRLYIASLKANDPKQSITDVM